METPPVSESATAAAPRPLLIVGGHLALDFTNTVDDPLGPNRWDHVDDYPGLLEWADRVDILTTGSRKALTAAARRRPDRAAAVVQQTAELRSALAEVFDAVLDGGDLERGWARAKPFFREAVDRASVGRGPSHLLLQWELDQLESLLWPLADAGRRLLTSPELSRLKRCAACPWLFLDHSRNHSRRWCSMEDCGTSEKMRRYVAKRASRRR